MSIRNLRWKGLAVSTVVVAAVAAATLATTTLLGVTFAGEGSERVEGARPTTRGPGLTICVQAVEIDAAGEAARGDPAIEALAQARVEEALVDVAKHPYWEPAGLAVAPPVVDVGCPSDPLVMRPGVEWKNAVPLGRIPGPHVTEPSPYEIFVFVMPSLDHIDHLLGGTARRVTAQEMVCPYGEGVEGLACGEETEAIYVTPEEIEQAGPFLSHLLAQGARIESR